MSTLRGLSHPAGTDTDYKILGKDSSSVLISGRPGAPSHKNHIEKSLLPSESHCCLEPRVHETDTSVPSKAESPPRAAGDICGT